MSLDINRVKGLESHFNVAGNVKKKGIFIKFYSAKRFFFTRLLFLNKREKQDKLTSNAVDYCVN